MTNIALVVLDTLRKDHFDKHFDWLPGTRFENAWSTSHWTVPVHASLFTGKYASEVGIVSNAQMFDCEESLLAEKLSSEGYNTCAYSANPNISPAFHADRGFDIFWENYRNQTNHPDIFNWEKFVSTHRNEGILRFGRAIKECIQSDCRTIDSLRLGAQMKAEDWEVDLPFSKSPSDGANDFLSRYKEWSPQSPQFLFINLMEAHAPYNPPEEYGAPDVEIDHVKATLTSTESDPEDIQKAYDASVQYLSDRYKLVFEELQKDFDIIITVGDHGEMLGEKGNWGHQTGIQPQLVHVPLSIYPGNGVKHTRTSINNIYDYIISLGEYEFTSEQIVTEYHGLPSDHIDHLDRIGINASHMSRSLDGVVTEDGYVYETFKGYESNGPDISLIEEAVNKLNRKSVSHQKISNEMKERLQDLGYV